MHQSKKGIVLKQLNGLLYGVEYLNGYVGQETQMKSAALRGISIYLIIFYRKAFRIRLTWKEWMELFLRLKRMPIHKATETTRTLRKNAKLKNLAGRSYVHYLVISYYYQQKNGRKV